MQHMTGDASSCWHPAGRNKEKEEYECSRALRPSRKKGKTGPSQIMPPTLPDAGVSVAQRKTRKGKPAREIIRLGENASKNKESRALGGEPSDRCSARPRFDPACIDQATAHALSFLHSKAAEMVKCTGDAQIMARVCGPADIPAVQARRARERSPSGENAASAASMEGRERTAQTCMMSFAGRRGPGAGAHTLGRLDLSIGVRTRSIRVDCTHRRGSTVCVSQLVRAFSR